MHRGLWNPLFTCGSTPPFHPSFRWLQMMTLPAKIHSRSPCRSSPCPGSGDGYLRHWAFRPSFIPCRSQQRMWDRRPGLHTGRDSLAGITHEMRLSCRNHTFWYSRRFSRGPILPPGSWAHRYSCPPGSSKRHSEDCPPRPRPSESQPATPEAAYRRGAFQAGTSRLAGKCPGLGKRHRTIRSIVEGVCAGRGRFADFRADRRA